jgi:hypothetical protein
MHVIKPLHTSRASLKDLRAPTMTVPSRYLTLALGYQTVPYYKRARQRSDPGQDETNSAKDAI